MEIPSNVRALIAKELRDSPRPVAGATARRWGVALAVVHQIMEEEGLRVSRKTGLLDACGDQVPDRLKDYVLYIKLLNDPWPITPEIDAAREEYDAGKVELCQGRLYRNGQQDALVLYCIPRKNVDTNRRPYFSHVYEG